MSAAASILTRTVARSRGIAKIFREPRAAFGMSVLIIVALAALVGPLLYPYDPIKPDYLATLAPPSWAHPLGTDDLGRDILARIIAGARISLLVGCVSVGSAIIFGTSIGIMAGFYGGWISMGLMRIMDVLFAFPPVLLALGITAVLGPSLTNAMLAISVVYLPIFARLARAQTLVVRDQAFTESDRAMGFSDLSIMLHAILPNIMAPLIVQASLLFGDAIITESYLSFLGLGTQPPQPSWGAMLKNAIGFLTLAPWMAWFPGLAIFVAVLGLNLVGDGLRDHLDPRLRK